MLLIGVVRRSTQDVVVGIIALGHPTMTPMFFAMQSLTLRFSVILRQPESTVPRSSLTGLSLA